MKLQEHLAQISQYIFAEVKVAIAYLSANPGLRYALIVMIVFFAILLLRSTENKDANASEEPAEERSVPMATRKDFDAIAGDDVISTQLDLAKAYIEMNQKSLAKQIIKHAIKQGSVAQQAEARQLLSKV